jgi:hypothetical protein
VPRNDPGLTAKDIAAALRGAVPLRTVQYRLRHLVAVGHLQRAADGRQVRYRLAGKQSTTDVTHFGNGGTVVPAARIHASDTEAAGTDPFVADSDLLSPRGRALLQRLRERPPRRITGERRRLLEAYRPDGRGYLTRAERAELAAVGGGGLVRIQTLSPRGVPALGEQFELDLVWNTARLSGSRYTEPEARRLLKFGRSAGRRDPLDTQSILNHRDASRFLYGANGIIEVDAGSLRNLHAVLAHNLIPDESTAGHLRAARTPTGVDRAPTAHECAESLEQAFLHIIGTANAIIDPFEQSLFLLVQIPYVAPFPQMNESVALFAANIPLIRSGLTPITFVDWPRELFADAVRGVVERHRVGLMRDLFVSGYRRSAEHYGRRQDQSGHFDPFRLVHDAELRAAVSEAIRQRVLQRDLPAWLEFRAAGSVASEFRQRFAGVVTGELAGLDEGNYARYGVSGEEFRAWRAAWQRDCTDIQRSV